MSIALNSRCFLCNLRRNVELARSLGDEDTATAFTRDLMAHFLTAPKDAGSPWLGPGITDLLVKHYGLDPDRYREEKALSNRFVMERIDQIRTRAEQAEDPVYAGLQLAVLGNYIDFSCLREEVDFSKLDAMLESASDMELDRQTYERLCRELETGKELLYITDNAGEIGFDRVLAEQIRKRWPHLTVTFCVKGAPANNDATREDAAAVGLDFPMVDTGNRVAGMELTQLGPEARAAMDRADVILSKGQANVETMFGCGYNIYYCFLVKCELFIDTFHKPKFTPMLVRELDR